MSQAASAATLASFAASAKKDELVLFLAHCGEKHAGSGSHNSRVRSLPPKVRERLKGGDRVPPSPREANGIVGLAHFINFRVSARKFPVWHIP
jgi:hypothetical protein